MNYYTMHACKGLGRVALSKGAWFDHWENKPPIV